MKYPLLFLTIFVSFQSLQAQIIAGDFADPSIIKANKSYYAVGTSSEWAPHFPIYTSDNLQNWKQVGYVFDKAPDWTAGSFWAPEYYFHNNTYYIYYTARRKKDNICCIAVATSQYPDRGFKDHGVLVSFGKEAIDAFVYNDKGQLYITFKAYGLDDRPIEILCSKLSADGLKLEGEPFSVLKDSNKQGMEGQSIIKKGAYYYLFYSAGGCCGLNCSYNVRVARSKNFKGPYEYYSKNPLLTANEVWKCPGHGTFLKQDDGQYKYIYHAYNVKSHVWTGRQGMMADLVWPGDNGWPSFIGKQVENDPGTHFVADFNDPKPALYWSWDFRHASPVVRQENGQLHLSGTFTEGNHAGLVWAIRPVSARYDMITTVANSNAALKGLAVYGDANQAIGIGVENDTVKFWAVNTNNRFLFATQKIDSNKPVRLKLSLNAGSGIDAFCSQEETGWTRLLPTSSPNILQLPQWDRSPRPGLHFKGKPDEEAVFSSFELINR